MMVVKLEVCIVVWYFRKFDAVIKQFPHSKVWNEMRATV